MKNLIKQFEVLFNTHEGFRKNASDYSRAMKTEDWKFLVDAKRMIQGQMAVDMFSLAHTKRTSNEKDVVQRTYYNVNLILEFLVNPHGWMNKKNQKKHDLIGKSKSSRKEGTK